ncbi:MAG: YhcH/YjgK/YiaL family protein [Anaerolineae bacterium]|nr:YhcH/YjgK/YiaL family protein [Anaerolineae bacterium]
MIVCKLDELGWQMRLDQNMQKALQFLQRDDLGILPNGRIEIDGESVYARILEYETIPLEQLNFEAHKKYIDIHFVVAGKETIGYIHVGKLADRQEYNIQKDTFHASPANSEEITWIILSPGEAAVFYPTDAHAPKGVAVSPCVLKKIVLKVAAQ